MHLPPWLFLLQFTTLVAACYALWRTRGQLSLSTERAQCLESEVGEWQQTARDAASGLGVVIEKQFDCWRLTKAERQVAELLLKGLAHKEIAELRQVGSATVRQQAQSVYRKAGVSGRADLAAWFIEDLF